VSVAAELVPERPARWPWYAFPAFLGAAFVGLVAQNDEPLSQQVPYVVAFTMFWLVGAVIVSRVPRNTIGLFLLYTSAVTATAFLASELTTWLIERGHRGPGVAAIGLLNNLAWLFGFIPVVFILPLLFPDGRLPSKRWKPYVWFVVAFLMLFALTLLFGQRRVFGSGSDPLEIPNPLYIRAIGRLPDLDPLFGTLFPLLFAVSAVSLVLRFHRSKGVERQQIKWVAFGLPVALVGIFVSNYSDPTLVGAVLGAIGFLAFPVSIGIAILRFHLYDLDVVVRKTVVYAALALFATLVYLALVVGLGAWLGRGSSLLTIVAAVVVAAAFQPVRARLNRFANRLVYGRRATPYQVLSEFSERVGEAYASEDVLPRMARILGEGVAAERADIWLAVDRELRDVAVWPDDADQMPPVPLTEGALPAIDGVDRVFPVQQGGDLLGALAVRKPASEPVSPADEKLVADLASQAGLVLRNVRLTEELKARLKDLKGAQKRLVSAQDLERRRLERNIHDGAQQQLVALAVKSRLARSLAERDGAKTAEMLEQIERETQAALEDLRDLARGIYPPLLADQGLVAALQAQARKVPVPVELQADGIGRQTQEVEAAVYFSVLECLQNVAKYARASRVVVSLAHTGAHVGFEVADDGMGFDPDRTGYGTGLQGIADRLAALDGTIEVRSALGQGSTISGRIPAMDGRST
jgi:signal transduction histidine kinase